MTSKSEELSDLWEVANFFYLGNYNMCVNEAGSLLTLQTAEGKAARESFLYRSYVAMGSHAVVESEVNDRSSLPALAVRVLSRLVSGAKGNDAILSDLNELMAEAESLDRQSYEFSLLAVVAATIKEYCGDIPGALSILYGLTELECRAMRLQLLLKLNRADLAESELQEMRNDEDDATVTQLSSAWLGLAQGDANKIEEARYTFHELAQKYGESPMLLNGVGVCLIAQQKYVEAEKVLKDALQRNPTYPDTLANLATCTLHLDEKPAVSADLIARYTTQLKTIAPRHPRVQDLENLEQMFEKAQE